MPTRKPLKGFVALPRELILRRDLGDGELRMYCQLLAHAQGGDSCCPSQAALAEELAVPMRTVRWRLANLVRAGVIEMQRMGQGRPNEIRLLALAHEPIDRQRVASQTAGGEALDRQRVASQTEGGEALDRQRVAAGSRSTSLRPPQERSSPPRRSGVAVPARARDGEEERSTHASAEDDLRRCGFDAQEAHDHVTLYGERIVGLAIDRMRHRTEPPRHPRGWLKRTMQSMLVQRTVWAEPTEGERRARQAAEGLAAMEAQERERYAKLKRRWEGIGKREQRRLCVEARNSNAIVRRLDLSHPLIVATAIGLLEGRRGEADAGAKAGEDRGGKARG